MKRILVLLVLTIFWSISLNAQWTILSSGTSNNLYDVYFTSVDTGYIVGENGLIKKTVDGGENWTTQTSGVNGFLHGIVFINETTTGYAVEWNGKVIKTTDAGTTWSLVNSGINTAANLTGVQFTSVNTGLHRWKLFGKRNCKRDYRWR